MTTQHTNIAAILLRLAALHRQQIEINTIMGLLDARLDAVDAEVRRLLSLPIEAD